MIGNDEWTRYLYTLDVQPGKKVKQLDYSVVLENSSGTMNITDLQLQEGKKVSASIPETSDILRPLEFNIDEFEFLKTVSKPKKYGSQPIFHENVRNRFYNIVGRGHQVISIPNVFHEDYTVPVVTTGLDLELYAKEDFDLLRIRTNDGTHIPERHYKGYPELEHHPLNYRYTREFYFDGAKAGDKIELKATIRAAKLGNKNYPLSRHTADINGGKFNVDRQRFMLAPSGSFRLGIEFFKQVKKGITNDNGELVNEIFMIDGGIGFYGIAELNQWTYGVSKL